MLLYFIEPQSGKITVDDIPLLDISRTDWLTQVAWVPQQPHLFFGSVRENILLAKPQASFDELIDAAKAANADGFISHLPHGYDTQIGEQGVRLSGGQRQRIAIARAFLKNAPLLILDEATACLDRENENLIQEALGRLIQKRTVLIIAHRLRFAYQANQIIVMDQGQAVEMGDHLSLLSNDGQYRKLVATYERGSV
jgi:ATP-binding cassette subfamily C protein CydD